LIRYEPNKFLHNVVTLQKTQFLLHWHLFIEINSYTTHDVTRKRYVRQLASKGQKRVNLHIFPWDSLKITTTSWAVPAVPYKKAANFPPNHTFSSQTQSFRGNMENKIMKVGELAPNYLFVDSGLFYFTILLEKVLEPNYWGTFKTADYIERHKTSGSLREHCTMHSEYNWEQLAILDEENWVFLWFIRI
jgi:hypothetical protein